MLRLGGFGGNSAHRSVLRSFQRAALPLVIAVWASLIVLGSLWWAQYDNKPGGAAQTPLQWPIATKLSRDTQRPTLLVVIHPECPCSRATISELSEIMAQALPQLRAYVVFMPVDGSDQALEDTGAWHQVSRISGVEIVQDRDGGLLREFGALTSGQTYLYDERGQLVFSGGITPSRGQTGDNRGSNAIVSFLTEKFVNDRQTPTYGCALFSLFSSTSSSVE